MKCLFKLDSIKIVKRKRISRIIFQPIGMITYVSKLIVAIYHLVLLAGQSYKRDRRELFLCASNGSLV